MNAAAHIDLDAPRYRDAAAQILSRHDALQPEATITSAVRGFLTAAVGPSDGNPVGKPPSLHPDHLLRDLPVPGTRRGLARLHRRRGRTAEPTA